MRTDKTPGVYIEERLVLGNSVVPVPTAIPAFVGYTQKNEFNGQSLARKPIKVTSMVEFVTLFGGGYTTKFDVTEAKQGTPDIILGNPSKGYTLTANAATPRFLLYDSIRFFYANGGGDCYIVSMGTYETDGKAATMLKKDFEDGIAALKKEEEITMILIPDALKLPDAQQYYDLVNANALAQCVDLKSRITIVDFVDGKTPPDDPTTKVFDIFRTAVGSDPSALSYAVAYYPWLDTSVVQASEVDIRSIATDLSKIIKDPAAAGLLTKLTGEKEAWEKDKSAKNLAALRSTHNDLLISSVDYKQLMKGVLEQLNFLPPGPGMAGIYAQVDDERGVWKAPANLGLNLVIKPRHKITQEMQEDMNMPINGKAINAIRSFQGRGAGWIWGARTFDGNSNDWRYVNVRRLLIFLEQSVKGAAFPFVFEPNDQNTWTTIRSMIENFLLGAWKQGALVGSTPEQAFQVLVGLGITMTAQDILEGYLRVTVKVAPSRPAEFIVITFEQKLQEA
ncbi:MAG: phage tail sheath family protein [Phaeodactylibacter sp.]|nr:phage tail sheath family protein [Phaeodactylibacter sp.]MCB9051360.1 phage tail sheath family protein [Lewinellaceae bacterium]